MAAKPFTTKHVDALIKKAFVKPRATSASKTALARANGPDAVIVVRRLLKKAKPLATKYARYSFYRSKGFDDFVTILYVLAEVLRRRAPFEWVDFEALIAFSNVVGPPRAALKSTLNQLEAYAKQTPLTEAQRALLVELRWQFESGWHGDVPYRTKLDRLLGA